MMVKSNSGLAGCGNSAKRALGKIPPHTPLLKGGTRNRPHSVVAPVYVP